MRSGLITAVAVATLIFASLSVETLAKGPKGYRGGGRGRGGVYIGLGAGGLSYGYRSPGFSIQLGAPYYGRSFSYGYGYPGYFYDAPYYGPTYSSGSYRYAVPQAMPSPAPAQQTYRVPDSATAFSPGDQSRQVATVIPTNENAAKFQAQAEAAFREGQLAEAERLTHHAMLEDLDNGILWLFQSQVQFGLGEYEAAVNSLDEGLTRIAPADRGYVVEHYDRLYRGQAYVQQMKQLVEYEKQHVDAEAATLLRAYHYLFLGHPEAANNLLDKVEPPAENAPGHTLWAMLREALPSGEQLPPPPPEPAN